MMPWHCRNVVKFGRLIQHQHKIIISFNTPTFRHSASSGFFKPGFEIQIGVSTSQVHNNFLNLVLNFTLTSYISQNYIVALEYKSFHPQPVKSIRHLVKTTGQFRVIVLPKIYADILFIYMLTTVFGHCGKSSISFGGKVETCFVVVMKTSLVTLVYLNEILKYFVKFTF